MILMEVHPSWILRLLQMYSSTPSTLLQKEGRISNLNPRLTLHGIIIICDKKIASKLSMAERGFHFWAPRYFQGMKCQTVLVLEKAASPQDSAHLCSSWLHPVFILLLPSWTLAGFPSLKSSAAFLVNCSTYQPASWSLGAYWISDENTAELDKQLFSFTIISTD